MRYRLIFVLAAACICSVASPAFANGQPGDLVRILAEDGTEHDSFGQSVAVADGVAIVGAWRDDNDNGIDSGSAYLFDVATGQQLFKLLPDNGAADDWFGISVSVSGEVAIVGAPGDGIGSHSGSAFLFDVATGQQLFELLPDDGAVDDIFGRSVAVSGGVALVGSPWDDDNGPRSGSAYLFDIPTGQQLFKLLPDDGAASEFFGWSVAISGGVAVVGAPWDDENGFRSGSAYLFDVASGQQLFKLLPDDGAVIDMFGTSVAISGGVAIVGAYDDDNSGSAYLFAVATGQQLCKLLPDDGAANDEFGWSVAISGGVAVVGAQSDGDNGFHSGSAYLFAVATGQQLCKLLPDDGATNDEFGRSVAVSGDIAIVGAVGGDDDNGADSGSAYLVNLEDLPDPSPVDWEPNHILDSADFFAFIADFLAGDADFNSDTLTDSGDFFEFIAAFLEGC